MSNSIVQEISQAKFVCHNGRLVARWSNGAGYYQLLGNQALGKIVICFMFTENSNAAPSHYSTQPCHVESVHFIS
jgi:hypothetical protein